MPSLLAINKAPARYPARPTNNSSEPQDKKVTGWQVEANSAYLKWEWNLVNIQTIIILYTLKTIVTFCIAVYNLRFWANKVCINTTDSVLYKLHCNAYKGFHILQVGHFVSICNVCTALRSLHSDNGCQNFPGDEFPSHPGHHMLAHNTGFQFWFLEWESC